MDSPTRGPRPGHIRLLSHPQAHEGQATPIRWGAATPAERGPLIATPSRGRGASARNVIGTHSGSYSVYRALAVAAGGLDPRHQADLTDTSPTHGIGPHPQWHDPARIVALDPYGALVREVFHEYYERGFDIRPTIAVTAAHLFLPEIAAAMAAGRLHADGAVLSESGACVVTKAAIEPAWYLPGIAERFGVQEGRLRRVLFEQTGGMFSDLVTRGDLSVFLPPIGGQTVYLFGDVAKLGKPGTTVTARVHDECNGSDVFGSDICTCRPYLTHAVEECVKEAQRGGVGVVVYFRKEGRALGEVTKFLVYNARKRQPGGDRADAYFERTECVAGVQDMRFQELMPDVLHWLGITHIDRFVSMSNLKHDAVVASGISIGERVRIPKELVPADAAVEMDAKVAAGYYTDSVAPPADELALAKGRPLGEKPSKERRAASFETEIGTLRSPAVIRERCGAVLEAGLQGKLSHFEVHLDRLSRAVELTRQAMARNYPGGEVPPQIPPHSRLRHFHAGGLDRLQRLEELPQEGLERARSLVDLVVTSVLLDAGAGSEWSFREPETGKRWARSEGLAIASLSAFAGGLLSSDSAQPLRADAGALSALADSELAQAFQHDSNNALVGLSGRAELLRNLGARVEEAPAIFVGGRVGGLCDFLLQRAPGGRLPASDLLAHVLEALGPIWPGRTRLGGVELGDTWPHPHAGGEGRTAGLVPLHKLSQWLCYSLLEVLPLAGLEVTGESALTGLAEYRNGGLFLDTEVLVLREPKAAAQTHAPDSELVVEWRALTVALLDRLAQRLREQLGRDARSLTMAMVLEGGTWNAGREIARARRPGGEPPLLVSSDGTLF